MSEIKEVYQTYCTGCKKVSWFSAVYDDKGDIIIIYCPACNEELQDPSLHEYKIIKGRYRGERDSSSL